MALTIAVGVWPRACTCSRIGLRARQADGFDFGPFGGAGLADVGGFAVGLRFARVGVVGLDVHADLGLRQLAPACPRCPWPAPWRCAAPARRAASCRSRSPGWRFRAGSAPAPGRRARSRPGCRRRASPPGTPSICSLMCSKASCCTSWRVSMNSTAGMLCSLSRKWLPTAACSTSFTRFCMVPTMRDDARAPGCRARGSAPAGRC